MNAPTVLPCASWCLICVDIAERGGECPHAEPCDNLPCDHCPDCTWQLQAADDATWD